MAAKNLGHTNKSVEVKGPCTKLTSHHVHYHHVFTDFIASQNLPRVVICGVLHVLFPKENQLLFFTPGGCNKVSIFIKSNFIEILLINSGRFSVKL